MNYMIGGNMILAIVIFVIGAAGVMWRRDAITMFMCVELMFNAANLGFITLAQSLGKPEGVAVFLFVITIAAAEAAVGLALFIKIFDDRDNIEAENLNLLQR